MTNDKYIGNELNIFSHAHNWKAYWLFKINNYLGSNILEVGAGIGANSKILLKNKNCNLTCLEPDTNLANKLKQNIDNIATVINGDISSIESYNKYDSILYIDVLEHIKYDQKEMEQATDLLANDGFLIIISPAHNWLYSPFDASIGHFRRYNKSMLTSIVPQCLKQVKLTYLDSIGMFASATNKLFLKSATPSYDQIMFWDQKLVPLSYVFDKITFNYLGKSIIGVWRK